MILALVTVTIYTGTIQAIVIVKLILASVSVKLDLIEVGRGDSWIHGRILFSRDNFEVNLQWIECRRILEKSEIKRDLWGIYSRFQSGRVCNVQCACLDIMQKLHWLRALINTKQCKCRLHVVANEIFCYITWQWFEEKNIRVQK